MILSDWLIALFHGTEFYLRTQLSSIQSRKTEKSGINKENPVEKSEKTHFHRLLEFCGQSKKSFNRA